MELNIKEYFAPLLKWWWLILLTTAVAGVTSYFATRQQQDFYRTKTTLLVGTGFEDPNPSNAALNMGKALATFYVELANRGEVRDATAEALGLDRLPNQIFIRQVNENFIEIYVVDTVPERAQAVANELARQLVLRTPAAQGDDEFVNELLSDYEAQIEETDREISQKQVEIGEAISAREISQLQGELATLEVTKQQLTSSYANLLSSTQRGATNALRVIEEAYLPTWPEQSSNMMPVLTAAAVGLVLAAAVAYVLEYLDDSIRTPDQLSRMTGYATLAGIAEIRSDPSKLITLSRPHSPTSEAYRVLRTAIQFAIAGDDAKRILLISSAVPQEGKSTTAANLAVVMAQTGNRVLLIDADLRRPSQHRIFGLANKKGMSSLLLQYNLSDKDESLQALLEETVQETTLDTLHVMTCGPIPPNPSELLVNRKMDNLLTKVSDEYDFVILDSPPVLSVTDASVLSAKSDAMLLVVKAARSRKQYVKQLTSRLNELNANVLGFVLNALAPKSEGHSAYYYYKDPYLSSDVDQDNNDTPGIGPAGKLSKRLRQVREKATTLAGHAVSINRQ